VRGVCECRRKRGSENIADTTNHNLNIKKYLILFARKVKVRNTFAVECIYSIDTHARLDQHFIVARSEDGAFWNVTANVSLIY
jgi:hypothetical protein